MASIPVAALGYRAPGPLYLLGRLSLVTLDFIDNDHLLFTFHQSKLMEREAERFHEDQNIRAVVLDISTGNVDADADWRMHDRRRYLLAAEDGTFFIRQGDVLKKTDRNLELRPYFQFNERLLDVNLSPDRRMLIAESDLERHAPEAHKRLVDQALISGESLPDEDVQVRMIRLENRSVVAVAKAENPIKLAVSSGGYILHEQSSGDDPPGKHKGSSPDTDGWTVSYMPFTGEKKRILRLHSVCTPAEEFLNEDTVLLTYCTGHSADRTGRAVTVAGRELWTGSWESRLVWPTYAFAAGGSTFAIGWLRVSHPVDSYDPIDDSDVQAQVVQVLSTATGHLLFSTVASPVYSGGQNFALSSDGKRLAVLNHGAIEVYDVPTDK